MEKEFEDQKKLWQETLPSVEEVETESGIDVKLLYTPEDIEKIDYFDKIGFPGRPPFTRGPYNTMYRGKLWTMRQYAGFGTARQSNERFKYLLEQGVTGLSVAFDLPTQMGYDSDAELVSDEVGRVGVAIDTLQDMENTFEGIPLDKVSVNFTINSTAIIILAMYAALAEKKGIPLDQVRGTTQNDMIKEFLSRNTYIFPIEPSLKIVGDIIEYCYNHLPRFNPISLTGYHIRELGASPVQELALTLEAAIVYSELVCSRGIDFDDFAPRLSFHFTSNMELFEEVAKYRAARRMWYEIAKERFQAKKENSGRLRVFAGGTGDVLTSREPINNIIRGTIQCMVAALSGAQAVHVPAYDEAYSIPSEESATISLRTQQILAYETGITKTIDPLGGSYYVENLTEEIEKRAKRFMEEIEERGGLLESIKDGYIQRLVQERVLRTEKDKQEGRRIIVGENKYRSEKVEEPDVELQEWDESVLKEQIENLETVRRTRNNAAVESSLDKLEKAVEKDGENIFPFVLEAVKAYASVNEIVSVLKKRYKEYQDPRIF